MHSEAINDQSQKTPEMMQHQSFKTLLGHQTLVQTDNLISTLALPPVITTKLEEARSSLVTCVMLDTHPEVVRSLALQAPVGGACCHTLYTDLSNLVCLAEDRDATDLHYHDTS